jgi:hypothetical protein
MAFILILLESLQELLARFGSQRFFAVIFHYGVLPVL